MSCEPFHAWAARQTEPCFREWIGALKSLGATWSTFECAQTAVDDLTHHGKVPLLAARDIVRLSRRGPVCVLWDRDSLPPPPDPDVVARLQRNFQEYGKVVQFRGYYDSGHRNLGSILSVEQHADLQVAGCELIDCALSNGGDGMGGGVRVPVAVDAMKFALENEGMATLCLITDRVQDYGYMLATIKRNKPRCRIILMSSLGQNRALVLPRMLEKYVDELLDWREYAKMMSTEGPLPQPNYDVWRVGPPMDNGIPTIQNTSPDLNLTQIKSQDFSTTNDLDENGNNNFDVGFFDDEIFSSEESITAPMTPSREQSSHQVHVANLKRMLTQEPQDQMVSPKPSGEMPTHLRLNGTGDGMPVRPPPGLPINGAGVLLPFPGRNGEKEHANANGTANGAANGTANDNEQHGVRPISPSPSLSSILPMELKSGDAKRKEDIEMLSKIIRSISKHSRIGPALKQTVCTKLRQEEPMRFRGKASLREFIANAVENKIVKETDGPDGKELLTLIVEESFPPIKMSDTLPVAISEVPEKTASMARALHYVLFIGMGCCPSGKSFPNKAFAQNIPRCTVLMFSTQSDAVSTIIECSWLRVGVLVDWRKVTKAYGDNDMSDEEEVACKMCLKPGKKPTMVEKGKDIHFCYFCSRLMEENRRHDSTPDIVRRVEQTMEQLIDDDVYLVSLPLLQKYLMNRHPDLITSRARALASIQEALDAGTIVDFPSDDSRTPKRTVCLERVFEEANRPLPSQYEDLDTTKVQSYIVRILKDNNGWMNRCALNTKLKSKFGSKMGTPAARMLAFAEGVEKKKFHIGFGAFGQTVVLEEDNVPASLQAMEDRWIRSQAGYSSY